MQKLDFENEFPCLDDNNKEIVEYLDINSIILI